MILADRQATGVGFFDECLSALGMEKEVFFRDAQNDWPPPKGYDLILSLGSLTSVCDTSQERAQLHEISVMREAMHNNTPVLGMCYGAQLLSRTLGAPPRPAPSSEVGWVEVDSIEPSMIPTGPWLSWHTDLLTVPAGATLLARTRTTPQTYVYGQSMAVLFHAELTPHDLDQMIDQQADWLIEQGVDCASLHVTAHRRTEELRQRAHQLFYGYWSNIAKAPPTEGSAGDGSLPAPEGQLAEKPIEAPGLNRPTSTSQTAEKDLLR
ncbi:type 1 glutamine amidotransferase [Streptomyces lavendofoliae]|uniref:type 1 glutamine amidotransferase n=1 Tax=Streptomyces lavendofoliae TaxID=67314 RepID=UPI003D8CC5C9